MHMTQTSLQVIYAKRLKRMTLQRALVSRLVHFPEKFSHRDLLALVDNMLWFQDKCKRDPDFAKKFGVTLKVLTYCLKQKLGRQVTNLKSVTLTRIKYLSNVLKYNLEGFYFPKRNTANQYKQVSSLFEVRPSKTQGVLKSQLPPEKYIAKGYRDKGTAKIPELDNSPSWQEVASQPFGSLHEIRK
jgi:hypothetical protein